MPDLRDLRGRPIGRPNGDPASGRPHAPGAAGGNGPRSGAAPSGHGAQPAGRTRAQERIDELDISPAKLVADIEQLRSELEATNARADEYLAGLQRERAEFSN